MPRLSAIGPARAATRAVDPAAATVRAIEPARAATGAAAADPAALAIHGMPGHYIRRLQQVAVALFARRLPGITPVQYAALATLGERGACEQAALAALIGYDRATMGGVIGRMEARGFVRRAPGRHDRRTKLVSLTAAGRAALRRATPRVERVQEDILGPLAPAERRAFARLCAKLLRAHE